MNEKLNQIFELLNESIRLQKELEETKDILSGPHSRVLSDYYHSTLRKLEESQHTLDEYKKAMLQVANGDVAQSLSIDTLNEVNRKLRLELEEMKDAMDGPIKNVMYKYITTKQAYEEMQNELERYRGSFLQIARGEIHAAMNIRFFARGVLSGNKEQENAVITSDPAGTIKWINHEIQEPDVEGTYLVYDGQMIDIAAWQPHLDEAKHKEYKWYLSEESHVSEQAITHWAYMNTPL